MSKILKVEILSYSHEPPETFANFWWSDERGLTCDRPRLAAILRHEGILLFKGGGGYYRLYPKDGRAFFDVLPHRFRSMELAQKPVEVLEQGGEPVAG